MLEGLPYVAILLLLLLLLLVLFLILLFIFLFLLCASRLSTRQSKVDGTLGTFIMSEIEISGAPAMIPYPLQVPLDGNPPEAGDRILRRKPGDSSNMVGRGVKESINE